MTLAELIVRKGWNGKAASEVMSLANAESVEVVDDQMYTWAGVAEIVGPVGAEALRLALDANGVGWAVHQLGGSGVQLSHPLVQSMLLGFAQANVPGCAELAAVGIHNESPWKNAGGESDVTLQESEDAVLSVNTSDRITNASALARERMLAMPEAEQFAAWAQCWEDAAQ